MDRDGDADAPGSPAPHVGALLRHFADLRDGDHGGAVTREDKQRLFARAAALLDPHARRVLAEADRDLLLGTGSVEATGVVPDAQGGTIASWTLSWPEQRAAGVAPVAIHAYYGSGFHHPHLRGSTVRDWPLNVFTEQQAAAEVPTLRAIVAADLHNLVFQRDYRLVPATVRAGPDRTGGAG